MAKNKSNNDTPETNAPDTPQADTPTPDKRPKAPKGSSLNLRVRANWKAIVEAITAGIEVSADLIKTAGELLQEVPSTLGSTGTLAEQLAEVETAIQYIYDNPTIVDGKLVRDEKTEEKTRVLLDRKSRIKREMKKAEKASAAAGS